MQTPTNLLKSATSSMSLIILQWVIIWTLHALINCGDQNGTKVKQDLDQLACGVASFLGFLSFEKI